MELFRVLSDAEDDVKNGKIAFVQNILEKNFNKNSIKFA